MARRLKTSRLKTSLEQQEAYMRYEAWIVELRNTYITGNNITWHAYHAGAWVNPAASVKVDRSLYYIAMKLKYLTYDESLRFKKYADKYIITKNILKDCDLIQRLSTLIYQHIVRKMVNDSTLEKKVALAVLES